MLASRSEKEPTQIVASIPLTNRELSPTVVGKPAESLVRAEARRRLRVTMGGKKTPRRSATPLPIRGIKGGSPSTRPNSVECAPRHFASAGLPLLK